MPINFNVSKKEMHLAEKIAERAMRCWPDGDFQTFLMDVVATHANGNPLKLEALLDADDLNFMHDISGIYRHLNRETGELKDCFLPRFGELTS